ncbi:unnamed protein product [Caenorhabditis brenneri]
MDPHHQRGFLVSGQRPPEMNLQQPDKDLNLGQLGTPASMNQFYPGSKKVDPVYDVNNLPVPDRNYHHQPETGHDKLVTSTDVMLSQDVTGFISDDELIQFSQEQNGTVSSCLSPGLLDIHHAKSPGNSPDNTDMMDYGMFDPGPELDGRSPIVQFSDLNGSNSNFGSPASNDHPIEDDRAMETQCEASHDGHGNALAADQKRQSYHSVDNLPIAPAQFVLGAGQFDVNADFYVGPQQMVSPGNSVQDGTVENTFRAGPDIAGHEVGQSTTRGHKAGYGSMGPLLYGQGDYYPEMDGMNQQGETQRYNGNGAPAFPQSNSTDRIIQDGTVEHIGHEGQLHVEQTLATPGLTYNHANINADPPDVGAQDHSNFCQPQIYGQGSHQAVHGSMGYLPYGHGDYYPQMDELHEPADTTVGEFCQRRMEMQQEAERQHGAMRNGAPQSSGNHFYQDNPWGQPTIGAHQAGHGSMGSSSYGQGDYYPQMDELNQQAEWQQYNGKGGPADQDVAGHEGQLNVEQTLELSGQTGNLAQNRTNNDTSHFVCTPDQPVGCLPGNLANASDAAQQALERQHEAMRNGALQQEQSWCRPTIENCQASHGSIGSLSYGQGCYYPQMDEDHRQAKRQHGSIRIGAPPAEQQAVFNETMRPLSYGQGDYHPEMGEGTLQRFTPHGPRQEVQQGMNLRYQGAESGSYQANSGDVEATDNLTGGPGNCHLDFQRIKMNTLSASLSDHTDDHISSSEESGVYSYPSTPDQTTTDSSTNGLHPPIFTYEDAPNGTSLRYQGAQRGSHQTNSGIVEAADNVTGGPGNCRLDFQRIKNIYTQSASLSDHTDDQISSSGESGFYSSPSTPDQTTTDSSTNGLLPPIVTSEEPLNQLFLPNFTVQSKDDEAFQQAQWDILMDYSDEELDRMDNNGFLLIDNNDNIGFDVDRLCETYEYYARGMDSMLPFDILSDKEVEHFSSTGQLMSNNNEGSASSSSLTPEKKRRNRRSGVKMTPEEKRIHKKEANRKYSTISRDKKKSERDITKRIWEYIQNEIQVEQAVITDVENNVAFANELLELTGQSSDLHGILQHESQVYTYWKGEISRVLDIRRDEDTKVQDALQKKQSAKEKFVKSGVEYQAKSGGKKTTTIGSQKTRALQNHELVKAQYHILVNRHDLRREKFLKGLADLYFRRTVSRYIQRIWVIPVEVHQLLSQEQKLHQLDKLKNFLRANRHLLKAPS